LNQLRGTLVGGISALEGYSDPAFRAPDDAALPGYIVGLGDENELLRNSDRTDDFERRAGFRKIADGAGNASAAERYRSGLQDPVPRLSATLIHGFPRHDHEFKTTGFAFLSSVGDPKTLGNA
jgi:hypothetical protein